MKNTKWFKALAAMVIALIICAGKSEAGSHYLLPGEFEVSIHQSGECNNPNGYSVVLVHSWGTPSYMVYGSFLLNGSESSAIWIKALQESIATQRGIRFYFDDNTANGFCGDNYAPDQGWTGAPRITTLFVIP